MRFLPQAIAIIAFNSIALVTGFNFLCHVWDIRFLANLHPRNVGVFRGGRNPPFRSVQFSAKFIAPLT